VEFGPALKPLKGLMISNLLLRFCNIPMVAVFIIAMVLAEVGHI